ncbi:unnamed protein product [Linum tenue]|nr:unnamed protein product [Linum tenue]
MTFEVGAVLEDAGWQAPDYCFGEQQRGKERNPAAGRIESVVGVRRSLFG